MGTARPIRCSRPCFDPPLDTVRNRAIVAVMSDPLIAADLCTQCGLCCNGALFDFGPLAPAEVEQARSSGLTVLADDERHCFGLPCPALDGSVCTAYTTRPETCRTYRCKLLRAAEAEDITLGEALATVARARAASEAVVQHLPPGATLSDARRLRREAAASDGAAMLIAPPALMIALGMLDLVLDQYFRKASERQVMPRD